MGFAAIDVLARAVLVDAGADGDRRSMNLTSGYPLVMEVTSGKKGSLLPPVIQQET